MDSCANYAEDVLKREVLEGDRAENARRKIAKLQRTRAQKDTETEEELTPPAAVTVTSVALPPLPVPAVPPIEPAPESRPAAE